jgi:transcriptional regulator with XRE-family HTH domain
MSVKDDLKQRRLELNLTMADVANKVGVSEATISRWESGDIANMRRDKIVLLAKALQVSPSFIMGLEEEHNVPELDNVYFSLAKNAQNEGIDPDDIRLAIDMIKKLKKRGRESE